MIITAALSSGAFMMDKEQTRAKNQEMIGEIVQAMIGINGGCE